MYPAYQLIQVTWNPARSGIAFVNASADARRSYAELKDLSGSLCIEQACGEMVKTCFHQTLSGLQPNTPRAEYILEAYEYTHAMEPRGNDNKKDDKKKEAPKIILGRRVRSISGDELIAIGTEWNNYYPTMEKTAKILVEMITRQARKLRLLPVLDETHSADQAWNEALQSAIDTQIDFTHRDLDIFWNIKLPAATQKAGYGDSIVPKDIAQPDPLAHASLLRHQPVAKLALRVGGNLPMAHAILQLARTVHKAK